MNHKGQTNDLVIRFANVNGTGSASANGLVSKVLFRMGLTVGPKNMFPSNIQGFPTWFEIRVSEKNYTGRRGGCDIMVAMNPQSFQKDLVELNSGGYFIYDESRHSNPRDQRDDITFIPLPLTTLSRNFPAGTSRAMLKNILYVGALKALIDLDADLLRGLIEETYGKNPALMSLNLKALEMGEAAARNAVECPLNLKVKKSAHPTSERILIDGNEALALGALFAGATVAAWYPITPSTSVVDHFTFYCHKFRIDDTEKKALRDFTGRRRNISHRNGLGSYLERSTGIYSNERTGHISYE